MLNKIFIMGRLTRDPELRRTQSGTAVTSPSPWPWTGTSSPRAARRRPISSTWWPGAAQPSSSAKYFTKGRMAVVEGRLQIRDWKDQRRQQPQKCGSGCRQRLFRRLQAGRCSRRRQLLRSSGLWRTHRRLHRPCGRQFRICRDRRRGRRPAVLITPRLHLIL